MSVDGLAALQGAWLLNAVAASLGLAWNVRLWGRWTGLLRDLRRRGQNGEVATALATRRRDTVYRVLLKAGLASYAAMRWEILTSVQPAALDWRQAVDVGLFSGIIAVLSIWSVHAWAVAWRRQRGGAGPG